MDRVDIYILNTDILEGAVDRIIPVIAPYYANKYEKMKVHSGKMQELGAGYLLSKVLGITRDEQLSFGEHGKPCLSGQYATRDIHENIPYSGDFSDKCPEFSLSHADNYVILAVAKEPVGVDIERCDRLTLSVIERVLPQEYFEKLESIHTKQEWAKAWTSVEAVLKADGRGFSFDPREDASFMNGWHIESFPMEDDFMVSCACRGPFSKYIKIVDT
ncbi:4'-phosphopantetheinyl transferase family protein [Butyrivibrio sp. VCD2006]|uniref:4'-phosphopantetheinyl transferase family protein n=1 Tax=Butyrivibrio sp. VCD2006 TaxID=1280664 RepID=UPI0004241EC6|nr:4'-phosphopantetheinyl transferase superfamily protein [Butyrivibrio sp. VCD2006]